MARPVVLLDELPWGELACDDLKLVCEDAFCRQLENQFRQTLYKAKHMRADMVVPPYVGEGKDRHGNGDWGLIVLRAFLLRSVRDYSICKSSNSQWMLGPWVGTQ